MNELTRYSQDSLGLHPDPDGRWIKHAAVESRIAELQEKLAESERLAEDRLLSIGDAHEELKSVQEKLAEAEKWMDLMRKWCPNTSIQVDDIVQETGK